MIIEIIVLAMANMIRPTSLAAMYAQLAHESRRALMLAFGMALLLGRVLGPRAREAPMGASALAHDPALCFVLRGHCTRGPRRARPVSVLTRRELREGAEWARVIADADRVQCSR